MVFACYPSSPKQAAYTLCCCLTGVSLIVVGARLSYTNIAPEQARVKARSDLLREHLRKRYGYNEFLRKDK